MVWNGGGIGPFTTSGLSFDIATIAYGGGKFVAGGNFDSQSKIAYSSNGSTWTEVENNPFHYSAIWAIAYGNDKFVAGDRSGTIAYSSDGITWTKTEDRSSGFRGITYGNNMFVAVGGEYGNYIGYSSDGINWSIKYSNILGSVEGLGNPIVYRIAYGNGKFVAVGGYGKIAYSSGN